MKTLKYIALAALTISQAACTQDEDFIPQGDADAVKITANIGKLQTRVSYDGKGNTEFDKDDQIRVKNTLRTSKNIATYNLTDEGWNTADAFVWNGGTSKNQFEAWYPVADYSSFSTFELPTDQSSDALLTVADWMTASTEEISKPEDGVLNLNFQHKLTKVTVTVSFKSEYPVGKQSVKEFLLLTNEENPAEVKPCKSENDFTAILLPGKYTASTTFIKLKMNEDTDYLTVPVNSTLTTGLEAGKHYTFNLTVGKDAATISSVSVIDWEQENIAGAVAEDESTYTYFPDTKTYYVFKAESLPDAILEASNSAGNIKLMADMELENNVAINKGNPRMLFDLNGHTITVGDNATCVFSIEEIGFVYTFTIDDTSIGKQGKIVAGLNCQSIIHCNTDKVYLTINNGTLHAAENTTSIIECSQAYSLAINGGTFVDGTYALKGTANSLLITGGCFTGATYDISMGDKTSYLSYNAETGIGATFTDGLSIEGSSTLKNSVATDAGYFAEDGTQITVTDDQTAINGTVIVKKIETNE